MQKYELKLLRIDLSNNKVKKETIPDKISRQYIGGGGLIAYYLYNELPAGTDPLSPENMLIFAAGPLTGIGIPGSGRHAVGAKSPLTNNIAKSEVGEHWGYQFRKTGFDCLIIEGKAQRPVYIYINDGNVEILPAENLKGKNTKETQDFIREKHKDNKIRVAAIGKGGENLIRFSCIMHGTYSAAGRGGLGAVMGSKNLKAVAVRGNKKIYINNKEGVKSLTGWLRENAHLYSGLADGTSPGIARFEEIGNLPVNNWSEEDFPNVEEITVYKIKDTIRIGMDSCYACPVKCKKRVSVQDPMEVDSAYGGPEYETIGLIGSNCGIDDIKIIAKASELCNAYALDTMSTGGTIAFAIECFEKGIINQKDTGGLKLEFGDGDAVLKLIEMIAARKGIGNILAEGSKKAAEVFGGDAVKLAMHVKGQEIPGHDPRVNPGAGLCYSIDPQGADHCVCFLEIVYSGYASTPQITVSEAEEYGYVHQMPYWDMSPKKIALVKFIRQKRILTDSFVICLMVPFSLKQLKEVFEAVTGWTTTEFELLAAASRIMTVCQLFSRKHGFTEKDDFLPERFFSPQKGKTRTKKEPLGFETMEKAKKIFFDFMGWDEKGMPKSHNLSLLDIEIAGKFYLNGEPQILKGDLTLKSVMESFDNTAKFMIVSVDKKIINPEKWDSFMVKEEMHIETQMQVVCGG